MDFEIFDIFFNNTDVCFIDNQLDFIYLENFTVFFKFIKVIFSLFLGTGFAIIFVSYCLYMPSVKNFEKLYNQNKESYEYDKFLIEYLDQYYELEETKDDEYLKTLYVKYIYYTFDFRDKTYKIIMNYDFEDQTYNYYLNAKSHVLSFDFLDTIARIYCVKYNCKNIYVDNYDNKEKLLNSLRDNDNHNHNDNDNDTKENKNTIFYSKNNKKQKIKSVEDYFSNKFKYKGLIKDFTDTIIGFDLYNNHDDIISFDNLDNEIFTIKKKDDFEVISRDENISFKDFKKSLKS